MLLRPPPPLALAETVFKEKHGVWDSIGILQYAGVGYNLTSRVDSNTCTMVHGQPYARIDLNQRRLYLPVRDFAESDSISMS